MIALYVSGVRIGGFCQRPLLHVSLKPHGLAIGLGLEMRTWTHAARIQIAPRAAGEVPLFLSAAPCNMTAFGL